MKETKFTKGEWIADIRGGCCAVYPKHFEGETNGCHRDDKRNIFYSSKGAWYDKDKGHWNIPEETKANAKLTAAAPDMLWALELADSALELCRQHMLKHSDLSLWDKLGAPEVIKSAIKKATS